MHFEHSNSLKAVEKKGETGCILHREEGVILRASGSEQVAHCQESVKAPTGVMSTTAQSEQFFTLTAVAVKIKLAIEIAERNASLSVEVNPEVFDNFNTQAMHDKAQYDHIPFHQVPFFLDFFFSFSSVLSAWSILIAVGRILGGYLPRRL